MKCIKILSTAKVYRVSDIMAHAATLSGQAVYANKTEWKLQGRHYKGYKEKEKNEN